MHLAALSSETQWRCYHALDTGTLEGQGDKAYRSVYELNRRFARPWLEIEAELRKRAPYVWLYKVSAMLDAWDETPGAETPPTARVAVWLGTERQALAKREMNAKAGVDQTL